MVEGVLMTESRLETIILRFRDLSVDNTIEQHNDIIKKRGFVWWGWWAKSQEKVPINEFNELRNIAISPTNLKLFLFHSSHKTLYEAKCTEIEYKNGSKITTPEQDATPEYYATTEYMAWFRLEEISSPMDKSATANLLKQYSYYGVPDFFETNASFFKNFDGKRIFSTDELADQQRTIWFLRKYVHGDKTHEIRSYSSYENNDRNVAQYFKIMHPGPILWLSDLHFSEDHHAFMSITGSNNTLATRINKELNRFEPSIDSISTLIISGDLTFRASKEEYCMALEFISDLKSMYSLTPDDCCICPGNHDLALSKTPFKENEKVTVAWEKSKENYIDFYRNFYGFEPNENLYSIKRFLTSNLVPVEIISLNSVLLQQGEHFMGMGFVGNDQLNSVESELAITKDKPIIRILVMHHHLLPVAFSERPEVSAMYSMMLDSEAVSQFIIRNKIGLVLHGHTHKEYYAMMIRENENSSSFQKFYIVGLGSTGAISGDLSENRPNMFSLLTFTQGQLQISLYNLNQSGEKAALYKKFCIPINDLLN